MLDEDLPDILSRLDLCHVEDGMAYWHPRGWWLFRLLEDQARAQLADYLEVRSPQLVRRAVWEASGHWDAFADAMFVQGDAALKPVSCPGHINIVSRMAPSYRDLPIRIAEMGLVHRDERDGALSSILRLRQFTQDDGHIFCREDQVAGEVERFCRALPAFYRRFGFDDIAIALSLRPDNRLGDDAWWDRAESELRAIAAGLALPVVEQPGAGAIYGPKLEFVLRDRRGRPWQCGTIQLDFVMPQRFDLRYVDAGGAKPHVVMLHRALYGSIERFLGVLVDHHRGALPAWLAPDQVAVLPVSPQHAAAAHAIRIAARVRVDDDGTVARRLVAARHAGIPFILVIGDREAERGELAVREGDKQWSGPAAEVIAAIENRCMTPA